MPGVIGPALAEALRISFDDAAADWFPPVGPCVDSLTAADAARPTCDANAPWQVLDHLRIGFAVWGDYLATGRFDPARFGGGTEWRPVDDPSSDAWDRLRRGTREEEARFRAIVGELADEELLAPVPSLGGTTRLDILLSTLAHLAFHAGELATMTSPAARRDAGSPGRVPLASAPGGPSAS